MTISHARYGDSIRSLLLQRILGDTPNKTIQGVGRLLFLFRQDK
ncbi:MAG: hypothetical protein WAM73_04145 [Desulfobacterales bacterium]